MKRVNPLQRNKSEESLLKGVREGKKSSQLMKRMT
jgi:hypothetical protein